MAKIVDPDLLAQGTEIAIISGEKKIQLLVAGDLDDTSPGATSGVALQAVYSFMKEEWKDQDNLSRYKFPLKAITPFKFEMQYGWNWNDAQTRQLIRDGGWKEFDQTEYACIISLGDFDADSDQAYYQNEGYGFNYTINNFDKTGELNEAIKIYSGEAENYKDFLKVFLRIQGKTFLEGDLIADQGWAEVDYDAYRMPLYNDTDINISASDATISTTEPYTLMTIDYLKGRTFKAWDGSALSGEVTQNGGRWYYATTDTSNAPPHADHISYSGERSIGGSYYAFNRIVSGAQGSNQEIYEFAQYKLRQSGDINDNVSTGRADGDYGTVKGQLAKELLYFVGTTLTSRPGVFIDDFDVNYQNDQDLYDITVDGGGLDAEGVPLTTTLRQYPFQAAGTMMFNTALVNDPYAKYWMYFKDANGNQWDTNNAILVENGDGEIISGEVTQSEITFTFDYTNNTQGGRSGGTDADVVVVAMGLEQAEWVYGEFKITQATGLSFPVNAPDERNYTNP
ncbi:MAG: hypothetical protein ACWGQW_02380 [bacterium]